MCRLVGVRRRVVWGGVGEKVRREDGVGEEKGESESEREGEGREWSFCLGESWAEERSHGARRNGTQTAAVAHGVWNGLRSEGAGNGSSGDHDLSWNQVFQPRIWSAMGCIPYRDEFYHSVYGS